jgi:hypothetical protein
MGEPKLHTQHFTSTNQTPLRNDVIAVWCKRSDYGPDASGVQTVYGVPRDVMIRIDLFATKNANRVTWRRWWTPMTGMTRPKKSIAINTYPSKVECCPRLAMRKNTLIIFQGRPIAARIDRCRHGMHLRSWPISNTSRSLRQNTDHRGEYMHR